MPSSPNYVRDYKQEHANYKSKPEQKKKTAARGRARYALMKQGRVRLGDGKDVDHKDTNALNNDPKNLRVRSAHANRSYPRNSNAGKK